MIKTTLKNIAAAMPGLAALINSKLPVKAAYAVSKLAKACGAEMHEYDQRREKIFTEAGCTVEARGKHPGTGEELREWVNPVAPDKLLDAIKQADELLTQEVELNALPLDLEQFGTADVPGGVFLGLDWAMKA